MQTFLKFVVSACATVCAFLIVPLALVSPAYGDAIVDPVNCAKCGCAQDANDPNSAWYCARVDKPGCKAACNCVLDPTNKRGCVVAEVAGP